MSYSINKKYALGSSQGDNNKASKNYIIIHDTGNDNNKGNDSAGNEASYMKGHWQDAYTHFIVDDKNIYQVGEPGYVAWGALDANPYSPMQVELANVDSQKRFDESYKRYIWLIRKYATKYGISLTLDGSGKGVKTHQWVTNNYGGDHVDPYGYLAKWGISKKQLAHDIKYGLNDAINTPAKRTYMTWNPKYIYTKKQVLAYKDPKNVGSGKHVAKIYKKHSQLTTKKLNGKTFQLDNGLYITSNNEYVNNRYYVSQSKPVKRVKSVNGTKRYKDFALTKEVDKWPKGTEFDIEKVVVKNHYSRLQLSNGLYISGNKLVNGYVK